MTPRRVDLVLLSGGLDSSTLLAERVAAGTAALALSVDYGQRHYREITAAAAIAEHFDVPHLVLDLQNWGHMLTGSALTDFSVPVPHGHYADDTMRSTIVPNRNATLLMAAAGIAQARRCTHVLTAVHAGDHPIYPDCRPQFIAALNNACTLGTDNLIRIKAPFSRLTKADIARWADQLRVPLELTWSCYEGGDLHCGRCGTCVERIEALHEAGVPDPTEYAAKGA